MSYKTDIQIAREAKKRPIQEIGAKLWVFQPIIYCPLAMIRRKVSAEFIKAQDGKKEWQTDFGNCDQPHTCGRRQDHNNSWFGRWSECNR